MVDADQPGGCSLEVLQPDSCRMKRSSLGIMQESDTHEKPEMVHWSSLQAMFSVECGIKFNHCQRLKNYKTEGLNN